MSRASDLFEGSIMDKTWRRPPSQSTDPVHPDNLLSLAQSDTITHLRIVPKRGIWLLNSWKPQPHDKFQNNDERGLGG